VVAWLAGLLTLAFRIVRRTPARQAWREMRSTLRREGTSPGRLLS
jgi:hypothetical protein